MDCYILHTVLLLNILLCIITIICFHSAKHRSKLKQSCGHTKNMKMENNEIKKVCVKNRMCYYFDDIIRFEDFDFDNILIDEKLCKNILINDISYKTLIDARPLHIRFEKAGGFIRVYDGTGLLVLFDF